jgi:hypothetical protein
MTGTSQPRQHGQALADPPNVVRWPSLSFTAPYAITSDSAFEIGKAAG